MTLRNRKQITVCRQCHMKKIHKGNYYGANAIIYVSYRKVFIIIIIIKSWRDG